MTWDEFASVSNTIIAAASLVGGAVGGLVGYVVTFLMNRHARQEQAKIDSDLQQEQSRLVGQLKEEQGRIDSLLQQEQGRLNDRLKRLETNLDTAGHVLRAQFDRELKLYDELWDSAQKVYWESACVFESPNENHVRKLVEANHTLLARLYRNRPFMAHAVHDAATQLHDAGAAVFNVIEMDGHDDKERQESIYALNESMGSLMTAIVERMNELSSVPQHEAANDKFTLPTPPNV